MKNQVRAYFAEAKWLHEEHVPTFESDGLQPSVFIGWEIVHYND